MILKQHLLLNSINLKHTMYLAVLGLATLPAISLANKLNHSNISVNQPKIGGKAAFNYTFDDTGVNKAKHSKKYGDWKFNKFILHLTGEVNDLDYKIEHIWNNGNNSSYTHFLETYVGHKFKNNVVGQVGNTSVPFGILDNLSWWKNIAFYAGFGDNYQAGIKMLHHECPWDFQLQIGKNSLVSGNDAFSLTPKMTTGDADNTAATRTKFSQNLNKNNEDSLQLAARIARTHVINDCTKIEIGLSAKLANTYNTISRHRGSHSAAAAHTNLHLDRWQVQLQFIPYRYSPKNGIGLGSEDNAMQLGKDGYLYTIPSKANIYTGGIAYKIPVHWGKIEDITVYNDYSTLSGKRTLKKTRMNIFGAKFVSGPLFVNADLITAQNMFGVGQDLDAAGNLNIFNLGSDNSGLDGIHHWKTKFNINFGVQF